MGFRAKCSGLIPPEIYQVIHDGKLVSHHNGSKAAVPLLTDPVERVLIK